VKESLNFLGSGTVSTDKKFIAKEYLAASHDSLAIGLSQAVKGEKNALVLTATVFFARLRLSWCALTM
jgi:hypothetical protein